MGWLSICGFTMLNRTLYLIGLISASLSLGACGGAGAGAYGTSDNPVATVTPDPVPTPTTTTSSVGTPQQSGSPSNTNPSVPSPFAGTWRAAYDGVDKGSCAPVVIDSAGVIGAPCFSSIGNPSSFMQGTVAADGKATVSFGSLNAIVKFSGPNSGAGTWSGFSGIGTITFDRVN